MRIEREDEELFHQDHPRHNGNHHEKDVAPEIQTGKSPVTTLPETDSRTEVTNAKENGISDLVEEKIASDSSSSSEDCLTCSCSSSSSSSSSCCSEEDGDGDCNSQSESDSDATITNETKENDDDVELEPELEDSELERVDRVRIVEDVKKKKSLDNSGGGSNIESSEGRKRSKKSNVVEWNGEIDRVGNGHAPGETGISTQDYPAEDLDPLSVSFSVPVPSARAFSYIHSPTSSEESDDSSDPDSNTNSNSSNTTNTTELVGKKDSFTFSYNYTYSFSCASEEDELDDEEKTDCQVVNSKLLSNRSISLLHATKTVNVNVNSPSTGGVKVSKCTSTTTNNNNNSSPTTGATTDKNAKQKTGKNKAEPVSALPDGEIGLGGKVSDDINNNINNNIHAHKNGRTRSARTVVDNGSVFIRDSQTSSPIRKSGSQIAPVPDLPEKITSVDKLETPQHHHQPQQQLRGHGPQSVHSDNNVHSDNSSVRLHSGQVSSPSSFSSPTAGSQSAIIPFFNGFPLLNSSYKETPPPPPQKFADPKSSEMHQRLSGDPRLRSLLKKPGQPKKQRGRSVTFNESLNLFYEAECSCWIHEDDYARLRQEEQQYLIEQQQHQHQAQQQQQHHHHSNQHQHSHSHSHSHSRRTDDNIFHYEPPPIEFEDPPTLSPPEGYKDRFFPQDPDPDVTRVSPPSPPAARRKVFLKEDPTVVTVNGVEGGEDEEDDTKKNKGSRLGGILKGGRLWRSNSADGKKVTSPPEEPDVVKCTERDRDRDRDFEQDDIRSNQNASSPSSHQNQVQIIEQPIQQYQQQQSLPSKVSTGTAPLRTSEQIRLAVDSTLRHRTKRNKPECSSLVEKLRWLTSLDDEDSDSNQSGFATWPSREKNGPTTTNKKSDAGTSTNEEFVQASLRTPPSTNEAKIKQISYTLEDIDEGLKGTENELETFITEDGGRIERLRKRYGEEGADDYGFSRRPSVKGIKPKFSSTNQIFAQFTAMRKQCETPIPMESQYENTRISYDHLQQSSLNQVDGARILNYEFQNAPGRQSDESRAHFEMIRQSFEQANFVNFNRPHSWSVSTLPHPHSHSHSHSHSIAMGSASPAPPSSLAMATNNLSGSTVSVNNPNASQLSHQNSLIGASGSAVSSNSQNNSQQQLPSNHMGMMPSVSGAHHNIYGTLPSQAQQQAQQQQQQQQQQQNQQQPIYGTVRRVPNVIGRPLFLHYGALSVEAHPNKIVQPYPRTKVPETPSPTQQPPPIRYYGPPVRYYNPPPPVPPRSVTTTIGSGQGITMNIADCLERGVPEGATDEEPSLKEPYSMNV